MRAERGEARLDGLFVADVREVVVEEREARAAGAGGRDSSFGHRGQQTHRFEKDGLAARVWTGDDERALVGRHLQIEGYDVDTTREQERMTPLPNGPPFAR